MRATFRSRSSSRAGSVSSQGDGTFSNAYARWDHRGSATGPVRGPGQRGLLANPEDYELNFDDISFIRGLLRTARRRRCASSFLIEDTASNQAIATFALVPGDNGQGFTADDDVDITR